MIYFIKEDLANFYKEAHQVIIEKKLAPCEEEGSLYIIKNSFVTTKESLKKIESSPNVYNVNKCASDLLDQILP